MPHLGQGYLADRDIDFAYWPLNGLKYSATWRHAKVVFRGFFFVFLGGRKPFIAETSWLDSATFLKGFVMIFFLKHARIQNLWLLFGLRQAHRATQDPPLLNDLPSELVHVMAVGFPILACKLPNLPFLRVKLWTCFDWIAMNDILKLPTNISVLDQFPCYSFSRFGSDDWNMF